MKDNKELNALNDEELEDVNAGRMSSGAIAGTVTGAIAGAALLATAIGVPLAKKIKADKASKNASASKDITLTESDVSNFLDGLSYDEEPTLEQCNNNKVIYYNALVRYQNAHQEELFTNYETGRNFYETKLAPLKKELNIF